jgi:radical SAM-linked protein
VRAIIKYARHGAARFVSHLDMQRAFGRALRRAKLPVKFSEGFNPHILMSFASPLSVGIGTEGDYLEVRFLKECAGSEIKDALNAVLPEGLRVVFAGPLFDKCPKLMAISHSAEYELVFNKNMEEAAQHLLQADSFVTRDRKGREIDVRPLVLRMDAKENMLKVCLANSSSAALNPATLAGALGEKALMTRLECFCMLKGEVLPMKDLSKSE